ncbi:aminoacyl-tRNA hydrolase [Candidatus Saccharibacteria bacterium]|nr:aminoacyl-tRNA hydrolase [Candidatus Saccharibacteria bacterium]
MAWLQRRPQVADPVNFVSIGMNKTLLVVGLGNPGKEYDGTRHNIGFDVVEAFAKASDFGGWVEKKDMKCMVAEGRLNDTKVILMKPTTFMNLSGEAVQAVTHFYKIPTNRTLVIHDELDVNFGQIRTRAGGSSAGHNGVKSVSEQLGDENYGRVRIGIGPKKPAQIDSADFVLQKFSTKEQKDIPALVKEATAILSEYAYGGGELLVETRSFLF